ncbi:dienelactone hydrolase [Catenuloplanes nepalensis]|uniref:Dienelactone hydrolase n=1 Tax=Catenuloplanes nepalensis TaxID=587533 RepID=A0ABT9MLR1_9ACTN|nr:prolyl oligopeptidase family serine peptidase [Catenuloplanes nepalensis]MDP9792362.1 dienelactone hydrolase [Catenuloplanes nepalensis]
MRLLTGFLLALISLTGTSAPAHASTTDPVHVEGLLPGGATYVFDVPARWNRTVLLYSHGYVPRGAPNPAQNSPGAAARTALLEDGYALIGSSYASAGWTLEQALPDQIATLDAFTARFGTARRTVAWGTSLGGMITTGLLERYGHRFTGGLAMCGLQQGGVANWNNTLDPLFALRTLLLPGSDVPLVRLPDQATAASSIAALSAALGTAQDTPLGRARATLAAALHNISPAALGITIHVGLSWRQEAESRAGGNMSWNTGVDYRRLLTRSAFRDEVLAMYRDAGASVEADLATLDAAPRISADPWAVRYIARNISFTGRLDVPLLTIHTTGDELVPVQVQAAYRDTVTRAGRLPLLRQAFVDRAGHCTFTTGEMLAALRTVERRLDATPAALNDLASALDPAAVPAFIRYRPAPYPRLFDLATPEWES